MTSQLESLPEVLVLDTSVLINLTSAERWRDVMAALSTVLVTPQVVKELKRDPRTGKPDVDWRSELLSNVDVTALAGDELLRFLSLVGAAPMDSLGDGEAATLALAEGREVQAVIDERKARRVAASLKIAPPISTVSIYQGLLLAGRFSRAEIGDLVLESLSVGRMQVCAADVPWVVSTVGEERVRGCCSLRRHLREN